MQKPNHNYQDRKKRNYQRHFEVELSKEISTSLSYFVNQELAYFNNIIELLTPRLRTFPAELLSMKDKELKLWEICAEYASDPLVMASYKFDEWPDHLKPYYNLMFDTANVNKISKAHLNIIQIAATKARIHPMVRKNLATEALKHMLKQADIFLAAQKSETLKTPLQLLNTHTLDTKRHLQIPSKLISISYNESSESSNITIPYSKHPIVIQGADISENKFTLLILRHTNNKDNIWNVELKDIDSKYLLGLSDYGDRKKPR